MFFAIDPHNGVAIYEQIVRQMSFAIANRSLRAGDRVPSVRELARELAVNPNTVARAYRELQQSRILESIRGTGLVVAAGAQDRCQETRLNVIRARIRQVLTEATQSRLDGKVLRKMVEEELQRQMDNHGQG